MDRRTLIRDPALNNDNEGGGRRIFPGRSDPTDTTARNKVIVRTALDPPSSGFAAHFKVFDVDDPTPSSIDPSDVIDGNGLTGDDNFGDAATLNVTQLSTDQNGQAQVEFTVSMNAGDNYRVAVSFDPVKLDGLAVDDDTDPGYIPSGQAQLPGFAGKLSPMLTVWRRLWYEFDSMAAPLTTGTHDQTNYETHTVVDITHITEGPENLEFSILTINGTLDDEEDRYAAGTIKFASDGTIYTIWNNSDSFFQNDWIKVAFFVSLSRIGQTINVYDDWVVPSGVGSPELKRPLPVILNGDLLEGTFKPAYIFPESVGSQYTDLDIPFERHLEPNAMELSSKAFSKYDLFWYVYLLAGCEEGRAFDSDPQQTDATEGKTVFRSDHGIIYITTISEGEITGGPNAYLRERHNVVHEIGHLGGVWDPGSGKHTNDGSIMDEGAPNLASPPFNNKFNADCINVFRRQALFGQ
jgi:hypothetical protein